MANKNDEDAELILLAEECKQFKKGRVGQYILNRAAQLAHENLKRLSNIPRRDYKAIGEAQDAVKRYDDFEQWLDEAILIGDQVYQQHLATLKIEGEDNG